MLLQMRLGQCNVDAEEDSWHAISTQSCEDFDSRLSQSHRAGKPSKEKAPPVPEDGGELWLNYAISSRSKTLLWMNLMRTFLRILLLHGPAPRLSPARS